MNLKNSLKSIIYLIIVFTNFTFSQTPKDSCLKMHLISAQFSIQMPGGDLEKRFGNNLDAGGSYFFKTKKNFLFGLDAHYLFGEEIKEDVLAPLKTPEGTITNTDGNYGIITVNQRGLIAQLCVGKIIPKIFGFKISPNPNSGLTVIAGGGYLLHYINIFNEENNVPQISGDYSKGYDRLTGGICLKEFIGYTILSNNRLLNFYGGFEFYQGFTKSLRSYDYDLMRTDNTSRIDLIYGIRVGWILPIYKRKESDNLFTY
jgi:hypothetical protein